MKLVCIPADPLLKWTIYGQPLFASFRFWLDDVCSFPIHLLDGTAYICGGVWKSFLTDTIPNDIDIFFPSEIARDNFARRLELTHVAQLKTKNAQYYIVASMIGQTKPIMRTTAHGTIVTSGLTKDGKIIIPIHLIHRMYGTLEDVLKTFDFTISMFGTDMENLFVPGTFYDQMIRRSAPRGNTSEISKDAFRWAFGRYHINGSVGIQSLYRMLKFYRDGYVLNKPDILSLVERAGIDVILAKEAGIPLYFPWESC